MGATGSAQGCPVNEGFDPLSPEFLADPYAVLAGLPLTETPLFYAPSIGYYVLTRHADIEEVFRDPAAYSPAVAQAPLVPIVPEARQVLLAGGHRPQPSMVSLDEPAHARLRKPAARAFSAKRVSAMIPVWLRVTTRPVTIGGVSLPEGAKLFLWLAAAGGDGSVFGEPDSFDLDRADAAQHLAFGLSLHYRLGANLGKLETRLALEELARRYPRMRLAEDQQFIFHPNICFRGPRQLRVRASPV
jgi:cytochrome P450